MEHQPNLDKQLIKKSTRNYIIKAGSSAFYGTIRTRQRAPIEKTDNATSFQRNYLQIGSAPYGHVPRSQYSERSKD